MDAVVTQGLAKRYGAVEVLHGIDLVVPRASLFGFLGPNGAGKSTTIRILVGLLRATAGAAAIFGQDVWRAGPLVRREIGYLPGDPRFYGQLTGRSTIRFFAAARGLRDEREWRRLVDAFDLEIDKRVRAYSSGMKQKLGLILAMMHKPRLLILDEPTTGLDPLVRQTLADELRAAAADGRTVLFSSHTLSEVEELCDRVAILRDGRIIEQDRIEALVGRSIRHVEALIARAALAVHPPPPGLRVARHVDGRVEGTWTGSLEPLMTWLAACAPRDVVIAPPRLEDLFLAYYSNGAPGERK